MANLNRDTLRKLLEQAGMKKIRVTGNGFAALCCFHDNTKTPAWGMNLEGLWNCMNPKCAEKGNLVDFLVRVLHMPMAQAAEYQPAREAGDDIATRKLPSYTDRGKPQDDDATKGFLPDAKLVPFRSCPTYMVQRGYPKEFLRDHEIGYEANAEWPDHSVTPAVTFPVRDHVSGHLIGLTRRAIDPERWPPYAHDFDKNRTLYLLHKLRPGPVLITEGPCDALTCRLRAAEDAGEADPAIVMALHNAVATLGGKWSDPYGPMLRALGRPVWLAFDNDDAGMFAREKAIKELLAAGIAEIFVLRFPGHDPGDLAYGQTEELSYVSAWKRNLRS